MMPMSEWQTPECVLKKRCQQPDSRNREELGSAPIENGDGRMSYSQLDQDLSWTWLRSIEQIGRAHV